jgi:hypothetical protein
MAKQTKNKGKRGARKARTVTARVGYHGSHRAVNEKTQKVLRGFFDDMSYPAMCAALGVSKPSLVRAVAGAPMREATAEAIETAVKQGAFS